MAAAVEPGRRDPAPPSVSVGEADAKGRKYIALLATLVVSVTCTCTAWENDNVGTGNRVLRMAYAGAAHSLRYLASLFCGAAVLVTALPVFLRLLVSNSSKARIIRCALTSAMAIHLLCMLGAHGSLDIALTAVLLLLIFCFEFWGMLLALLCEPDPQNHQNLLRSRKRKHRIIVSNVSRTRRQSNNGDAYEILKESRAHLLLLGTLAATVTYQAAGLNPPSVVGGFQQGESSSDGISGSPDMYTQRYKLLVFCCYNAAAFVASLGVILMLLLTGIGNRGIRYLRALQIAVTLDLFCLAGAYAAGTSCQRISVLAVFSVSLYVGIHVALFVLQLLLAYATWGHALRDKIGRCVTGWLKKVFGMSTDDEPEEEDHDGEEEEEEEEIAVEWKQERARKLLLLLAILAAILAYSARASPPRYDLGSRRLAFLYYCNAAVLAASVSVIGMLANRELPTRGVLRWYALRLCVVLAVIGQVGAFAAGGYRKITISMTHVFLLFLAALLCILWHAALSVSGTARDLVRRIQSGLGLTTHELPAVVGDDGADDDEVEIGIAGGTNEEALGVEISSPIFGGALTMVLAVPVIDTIVSTPVKLLVGILIASIAVGLWRRTFVPPLQALLHRCTPGSGSGSGTASTSSAPQERLVSALCHGACKVIHTLFSGTWMWILILVIWVPSLKHNLKVKFKVSKLLAVVGVLLVGAAPSSTMVNSSTSSAAAPAAAIMDTAPDTAASSTSMATQDTARTSSAAGIGRRPLVEVEPRPQRNRRPNSRLTGQDWVN